MARAEAFDETLGSPSSAHFLRRTSEEFGYGSTQRTRRLIRLRFVHPLFVRSRINVFAIQCGGAVTAIYSYR
ncbi:MAG: hypothetical protein R3B96_09960 [Pirellulaceae bacterium]